MKKRLLILGVLLWSFILTGCSSNLTGDNKSTLTTEEKIEDFEQMYSEVEKGYPFLEVNKRLNGIDWLSKKEEFKEMVLETSSDKEFMYTLNKILRKLNNGHNGVISDKKVFDYYKQVYEPIGYFPILEDKDVIERYESMNEIKGIEKYEDVFKDIDTIDVMKGNIAYISIPQMNSASGNIDNDMIKIEKFLKNKNNYKALIIDIRGNTGGNDLYWMELISTITNKNYSCGGYTLFRNDSKTIKDYTSRRSENLHSIDELPDKILEKAPKEVPSMFTEFSNDNTYIKGKAKYPFNGNIYLLVDENVFSASESFAVFCKEKNFATIIGTKTGGDGYSVDPVLFKLNNSNLIVRMSSAMSLTESGICDEEEKVTPDLYIKNKDYYSSKVPLSVYVEKIKKIENIK